MGIQRVVDDIGVSVGLDLGSPTCTMDTVDAPRQIPSDVLSPGICPPEKNQANCAVELYLRRRAGKQSVCDGQAQIYSNVSMILSGVEVFFYDAIQLGFQGVILTAGIGIV